MALTRSTFLNSVSQDFKHKGYSTAVLILLTPQQLGIVLSTHPCLPSYLQCWSESRNATVFLSCFLEHHVKVWNFYVMRSFEVSIIFVQKLKLHEKIPKISFHKGGFRIKILFRISKLHLKYYFCFCIKRNILTSSHSILCILQSGLTTCNTEMLMTLCSSWNNLFYL